MLSSRVNALTETDVASAADRILRKGQRPTIERLRAELGRGSPNALGPWLDLWYKGLALRLDPEPQRATGSDGAFPPQLQELLAGVWQAAMAQASLAAETAIAERQHELQATAELLAQQRSAQEAREQAFEQMRTHLMSELQQTRLQLDDCRSALHAQEAARREEEARSAGLEAQLQASVRCCDDVQQRLATAQEEHQALQDLARSAQAQAARVQLELEASREQARQADATSEARLAALALSLEEAQRHAHQLDRHLAEEQVRLVTLETTHQAQTQALQHQLTSAADRERTGREQLAAVQAQLTQLLAQSDLRDRAIVASLEKLLASRPRRRGTIKPDSAPDHPVDKPLELE